MKKELLAILGSLFFIAVSIGLLALIKETIVPDDEGIVFTTILIAPVFVYLILSGRIKAFKAGNFEASFNEVVNEKVKLENQQIVKSSSDEIVKFQKGSLSQLKKQLEFLQNIDQNKKLVLTFITGYREDYYQLETARVYLQSLAGINNFKFAVICNLQEEVIAFTGLNNFYRLLSSDQTGKEIIDMINKGDNENIMNYPGFYTKTLEADTKNIDALNLMDELNLEEIIVTNDMRGLVGIVDRGKILSKLMIALSK